MIPVSLIGVASYLPEKVVTQDFFSDPEHPDRGMFTSPTTRRHVAQGQTAVEMIERASRRLVDKLAIDPARDIDLILTNVSVPDQAFTGCGAQVAHRLGSKTSWILDLHNTGCVSFVYMMAVARTLMQAGGIRGALLCNVQNAGGRVFSNPQLRHTSQAPVPGDGCGVGYLAASEVSPVLSIVQRCHGEWAADMVACASDGRNYWEPGESALNVGFSEARVASIIHRGNRLVPQVVREACSAADIAPRQLDLLVTNQPNPIFLRNWREALELPADRHHDSFDRYGNLFGAALPINLEEAIEAGKLARGALLALGGFSHAGDYAAASIVRWAAA